jgi:hypothetical protein
MVASHILHSRQNIERYFYIFVKKVVEQSKISSTSARSVLKKMSHKSV